jgi:EAL domain-containing protein (putative c-di-GMP-specific phosphodiesterase class I)
MSSSAIRLDFGDLPRRNADVMNDRFLAFAFAGADLLVETDPQGVIGFAAGAFRSRLGCDGNDMIGSHVGTLFAAADREALALAIDLVAQTGRIAPMALRLADPACTTMSVAALMMPSVAGFSRLHFSIGPMPAEAPPLAPRSGTVTDQRGFARIAEAALRETQPGELGLVELRGWERVRESLTPDDRKRLEAAIGRALSATAPGATAGAISEGRYGVLSPGTIDMTDVLARLEAALQASPAAGQATVLGSNLPLDAGGLPTSQAARALRYALGRFAEGGQAATDAIGSQSGLAGIVANAEQMALAVRAVLSDRRFRLVYQPIVRLDDRSVHHFEALLRTIPTPNMPLKDTQEFVTFAEAVGLSEELDWAVMEAALHAISESPQVRVAVNMSGLTMQNPHYGTRLLNRLALPLHDGTFLPCGRLLVELTETAEIEDLTAAAANMEKLRATGVAVCLDDFGAGAAAFRYLRAFGVDFVKLDGSYVRAAATSKRDRQLAASMVQMAINSGASVIAEMIETEAQCSLMRDLGVEYGQGWLFGKPGRLQGN